MRILAIDVGSSSVKAGLWEGGRFASRVRVPYRTRFSGDRAEIDPGELLRAVMKAGAAASTRGADAVAFCTFSSGVVVTDLHEKPLTPIITHADRRSTSASLVLVRRRPHRWWLTRTGNLPYPGGIGTSTLAWLAKNTPSVFRRRYRIGQVSSLIGRAIMGHGWLIDPSQAAFLGLWDIRTRTWSPDVCRAIGIAQDSLPDLRWADTILGGIGREAARRWNIKPGTPLIGGFIDTSAAVLQTPMTPGQLSHNCGSTDVLAMCVNRPHPAEGLLTRPLGVGSVFPERWLAVRTIAAAGSALQWVRTLLFPAATDQTWNALLHRVCRTPHRDGDQDVLCFPHFAGRRAALNQPAGALLGLRLSTSPREILQAVITGLLRESESSYTRLAALRAPQKVVYTMGGTSALANAMHSAWPATHHFRTLTGDGLRGLVTLADRTIQSSNLKSR
jgi:xylulokinase